MACSTVLEGFLQSIALSESLIEIDRTNYHNPPRKDEQKPVEALRGGAIILMVAAFERFLRQLIEYYLDPLTRASCSVDFSSLPEKMQIYSIFTTLDYAMKGKPYMPRLNRLDRLQDIDSACRLVVSQRLNSDVFCDTGSNPNSKTIKEMFGNLGITDPFGRLQAQFETKWGTSVAQTFIPDKLDEIINRRHLVAHTADALNITRTDLRTASKFLRITAELLEKLIKSHIDNIVNP